MISTVVFLLIAQSSQLVICGNNGKNKLNVKLVSLAKCEQPPTKWDPVSPINTVLSMKKISRDNIKVNITYNITRSFGPAELLVRVYQVRENSVKDLLFKVEHADCHSHLARTVINYWKLQYDKKCFLKAGVYRLIDFDFNNIKWIMLRSFTSRGRYLYEFETSHAEGATSCITIMCDVTV